MLKLDYVIRTYVMMDGDKPGTRPVYLAQTKRCYIFLCLVSLVV